MATPTKTAIIGTFINGRNAQDDFLQLKNDNGGLIFAWIDYLGNLHGSFLNIVDNLNLSSTSVITWNNDTGLSRGAAGVIDVGDGTFGDTSGTLDAASLITGTLSISGALTDSLGSTGTNGQVLTSTGSAVKWESGSGSGTVTSVTFTGDGTVLSSTPSSPPVTTSGTVTATLLTQSANKVLAGPTSGGAVDPTFRSLVVADIPSLPASQITSGVLSLAIGGTGANLSSTGGTNQVVQQSTAGGAFTVGQLSFSNISGQLGVGSGGTGANLSSTGGSNQVVQQTTSGGAFTVGQLSFSNISGIVSISAGGTGTASPALVAGGDITITGSWPNNTIAVSTQGGLTPGSYGNPTVTVDTHGIITAISSGSSGAPIVATVDLTSQTSAISTTTLLVVPSSPSTGTNYLLFWNAKIRTAATVSSTLGPLEITITTPDGVTFTSEELLWNSFPGTTALELAANSVNTTNFIMNGISIPLNCSAGSTISYTFGYASSGATTMEYDLHIRLLQA